MTAPKIKPASTNRPFEMERLNDDKQGIALWKKWGPYLSERQWGTVREDYSERDDAWNFFTHDQARYRAYRWGEDGIAGISDDKQHLCFALAMWNGKDPIIMALNLILMLMTRYIYRYLAVTLSLLGAVLGIVQVAVWLMIIYNQFRILLKI